MLRHRSAQTTRIRHIRPGRKMTPLARRRCRESAARNLLFAWVATDDLVMDIIAMAIDACQAGLEMDVLFGRPFLGLLLAGAEIHVGMAVVASCVRDLPHDVEQHLMIRIERTVAVLHAGFLVATLRHERIVGHAHIRGGTFHRSELTRGGRRPAVVLPDRDLDRPAVDASHVLAVMPVMTSQAVDLEFAGDILMADIGIVGRLDFSRAATGHVPTEQPRERKFRKPKRARLDRPGPRTVGERNLDPQLWVHVDPRLSGPPGRHRLIHCVEVPPALDHVVTMTFSTGVLRGERQERIRIGRDLFALVAVLVLWKQRDQVGRVRSAAVTLVSQQARHRLLQLLREHRRQRQHGQQSDSKDQSASQGYPKSFLER